MDVIDTMHFILAEAATTAGMLCDSLPVEETCSAMLSFPSGAFGLFDTSRVMPNTQFDNNIEIFGERGRCYLFNAIGGRIPQRQRLHRERRGPRGAHHRPLTEPVRR